MLALAPPIGLFGGTFDPIHLGHMQIAKQLLNDLNFSCIHFIPNRQSPIRKKPVVSAKHRLAMVRIATQHNSKFLVNESEIARPPPSYTLDTVQIIRNQMPKQSLCLILGMDAFQIFNRWYRWQKICEFTHLVIVNRPDSEPNKEPWMRQLLQQRKTIDFTELRQTLAGKIYFHTINPINIAATKIRSKLARHEDVSKELDPNVLAYIKKHALY